MAQVFISYSHADRKFAQLVSQRLSEAGIITWMDISIIGGQEWSRAIDEAIRKSSALITIVSASSIKSEYTTYEWSFALGLNIPVIPILIDKTVRRELPPRLSAFQYLDFTEVINLDRLAEYLKEIEVRNNARTSRKSLVEALKDIEPQIRIEAALDLSKSEDERSVPVLLDTIKGQDRELQIAAIKALVNTDPTTVLEIVLDALRDPKRQLDWVIKSVEKSVPRHIFLSYSREDDEIMQNLRAEFQDNDFNVWTDELLEKGTPSWKLAIEDAIENSGCLTVIFSPDAKKSKWVREEMDYAAAQNKQIFPVLAKGDEKTSIPIGFTSAQWTDIRQVSNYKTEIEKLIKAITKCLSH